MKNLLTIPLLVFCLYAGAQVKIGDNPATINSNSLLEMESTNKGFLPPRVALTSLSSVSPLTGTVPPGMLVYSTGGTLIDGFYYWDGAKWIILGSGQSIPVIKTANATLTKSEKFVLASNSIMLTLPLITSADDGLTITVKNVGTHTDFVMILGNSGALIDNTAVIPLMRWFSMTMTATAGKWVLKERTLVEINTIEVSVFSPWQTLEQAIEFLNLHMAGPIVIKLGSGLHAISETLVIDLPYALTIQGSSFGTVTIAAAAGLAGKPMFRCVSDVSFKMLMFDASTLPGYGAAAGEDAIRLVGSGSYHEIKDCTLDGFNNAILDSSNAELWLFECDIINAKDHGLLVQSSMDSVNIKVAETDFIGCKAGIHMLKGNKATIQLSSGGYYNSSASDTAIIYNPSTFTSPVSIVIKGNLWNNIGKYIEGFDFTRTDGRDANVIMENNAGVGDAHPSCTINLLNGSATTTIGIAYAWYKANWTNSSSTTKKWTVENNKITYQPANRRNCWIIISGNLSSADANRTISLGICKNGSLGARFGETTLRPTTNNQPFQFSTVVYLSNIGPGDYFELYVTSSSNGDVVTFNDILWLANTQ